MADKLQKVLALIGLSVLAIVGVDLAGRAASIIDHRFFDPPTPVRVAATQDTRSQATAYDDAEYDVAQLFREFHATDRVIYSPYTIWNRKFFKGDLVNIDISGNRATHNNSARDDALTIWMFGGSTLWGEGAPDTQTIPSHLADLLNNEWGVDSQVRNLGERGYVSTQEVVYLMRELQTRPPPHVGMFYDGRNDAAVASNWPEVPGVHVGLDRIRERFEIGFDDEEERRGFVRSLGLYRAARIVLDRIEARSDQESDTATLATQIIDSPYLDDADFDFLGELALGIWLTNHRSTRALGSEFGFVPIFLLHPSMWIEGSPFTARSLRSSRRSFGRGVWSTSWP